MRLFYFGTAVLCYIGLFINNGFKAFWAVTLCIQVYRHNQGQFAAPTCSRFAGKRSAAFWAYFYFAFLVRIHINLQS
jgi:hypothetical protein